MKKILTLCVIYNHSYILLGMKKRGFGKGRWNGFGGKLEKGESIKNSVLREVKEEIGVKVLNLKKRGILNFIGVEEFPLEVHIFSSNSYEGSPIETDEMRPKWFRINKIPFDKMWPDDKYWLPLMVKGSNFKGTFYFDKDDNILKHKLSILSE